MKDKLMRIDYKIKSASVAEITEHLKAASKFFIPPLHETVDIDKYSEKIFNLAETFEAWSDGKLIGLIAAYLNDFKNKCGFITSVSVNKEFMSQGISSILIDMCIKNAIEKKMKEVSLEVHQLNDKAIALYKKKDFLGTTSIVKPNFLEMKKNLL